MIARVFDGKPEGLSRDDVLDNITLYWLTNTAISSARLYWDTAHNLPAGAHPLQQVPQRHPLCCLGAAGDLRLRNARNDIITAPEIDSMRDMYDQCDAAESFLWLHNGAMRCPAFVSWLTKFNRKLWERVRPDKQPPPKEDGA
jgi:hypothetical protein